MLEECSAASTFGDQIVRWGLVWGLEGLEIRRNIRKAPSRNPILVFRPHKNELVTVLGFIIIITYGKRREREFEAFMEMMEAAREREGRTQKSE